MLCGMRGAGTFGIFRDVGIGGKAMYVAQYFQQLGIEPYFDGYQCGWVIQD
jgi:hypothetical protein